MLHIKNKEYIFETNFKTNHYDTSKTKKLLCRCGNKRLYF